MNEQNQTAATAQPQQGSTGGLQPQTSSIPTVSPSGLQGEGASGVLFGNPSSAGTLLNQSLVLGASGSSTSVPSQTPDTNADPKGTVPVHLLILAAVAFLILFWLFRRKAPVAKPEIED